MSVTSFIKRIRVRDVMKKCGPQRGTVDFYDSIDKAVERALFNLLDDCHIAYPNQLLTSEHLERLSIIKGGYSLKLMIVEPRDIELSATEMESLDDDDVVIDTVNDEE